MDNAWRERLWADLHQEAPVEQFIAAGEVITEIGRDLLPALGQHRRQLVLDLLAQPGWDQVRVAETIGTRPAAITRLADEARAMGLSPRGVSPVK